MVQQELYPSDEGREEHGDPREPRADEAAPGVSEALTPQSSSEVSAGPADGGSPWAGEGGSTEIGITAAPLPPHAPQGFTSFEGNRPAEIAAVGGALAIQRLGVWRDELVAWFKTLTSAAVYATLIVTFGFQVARVEGQSMAPTLEDQDRLIVNKLEYRLPHHDPRVGDIVMLLYPEDPDKSFVKRVIGEPGDTIRSVNGQVYRNDVPLPDDFIPEEYRMYDNWGPEIVPNGRYFVMGDHRNNSSDSRTWSFVPQKYIIGKVQVRWWPIDQARLFDDWE